MSVIKPLRLQVRRFSCTGVQRTCPPLYGPLEVQRSVLMNGIRLAVAKQLGAQMSACTIMYQVGSRHEMDSQLGATHFLRAASWGTGCGSSGFHKTRLLQQLGSSLTCSSDRQRIAFTLRCPSPVFSDLSGYLMDVAVRPCFVSWEIDDRKQIIHKDLQNIEPEHRVMDMIQTASFTGPLANSTYCNSHRIATMEDSALKDFAATHFKSDVCSVASYGLPYEEVLDLAEKINYRRELPEPRCIPSSFPRGGLEQWDLGRGSDTCLALAVPSCGTNDLMNLIKHNVIAAAAGIGNTQIGQHSEDRLPMTPLGALAADDINTSYQAFNISYIETGLFGILVKTKARTAWNASVSAAQFLTNIGQLSCKQIEIGKNRLKLALALHDQDPVLVSEGLALQAACGAVLHDAEHAARILDGISADELVCTAQGIASKCKLMSMAVVGDVGVVPHEQELLCGSFCDLCCY